MKVLLPEGAELKGFERELQVVLEEANLAGYALMGFTFREALSARLHEIDALIVMEPGVFVCLEAKGYGGKWTGNANEKWFCDGVEIKAVGTNPCKQAENYSYVIKSKLQYRVFKEIEFWVNYFVVAPDSAKFEIKDAAIDRFQPGRSVPICHVSQIEQVLGSIKTREHIVAKVDDLGLLGIISELTDIPGERLENLISNNRLPQEDLSEVPSFVIPEEISSPIVDDDPTKSDRVYSNPYENSSFKESKKSSKSSQKNKSIGVAVALLGIGMVGTCMGPAYHLWNRQSCTVTETISTEAMQGTCYKDITKTPLVIGILTPPDQYSQLATYLKQQLGSRTSDVVIEGGSEVTYQVAQDNIAKENWDIFFALSPMNGMRAKDNGYRWIAQMFPNFPSTYQSALFVKSNSSIQSIEDVTTSTTVALGDFSSASSFYIPAYDLYGKSMTVTAGNRSSEIKELVASKSADVGAAVYGTVKDDPRFRIIHVSREIPGSGVYLSSKLPPDIQQKVEKALMDAPQIIKDKANYGVGNEPSYEILRSISLRSDEVLSCADFSQNPVQFFCSKSPQGMAEGIVGKISGFTNESNGITRLRLEQEDGKTCNILIPLQVLSRVPGGTSPGILNRKRVSVTGTAPKQLVGGMCEIKVSNPNQLTVL